MSDETRSDTEGAQHAMVRSRAAAGLGELVEPALQALKDSLRSAGKPQRGAMVRSLAARYVLDTVLRLPSSHAADERHSTGGAGPLSTEAAVAELRRRLGVR